MSFMKSPKIKWRVRTAPQISANQLADYMSCSALRRETIVRDAKYQPVVPMAYHARAEDAISKFLADPVRNWAVIHNAITKLETEAQAPDLHPKVRERLLNNIAVLVAFELHYNKFMLGGMKLVRLPSGQPKSELGGVKLSINLDFIVEGPILETPKQVGGLLFDFSSGEMPKKAAAKARYESFARHAATLVHMQVAAHMTAHGQASYKLCHWVDVQRGKLHTAQRDYLTLMDNMEIACGEIAQKWENVNPPPGFDPAHAKSVP